MARTAHHVPFAHRDVHCDNHACSAALVRHVIGRFLYYHPCDYPGDAAHTINDLRYSAAELVAADRAGRRPVPERTVSVLPRHTRDARTWGIRATGSIADLDEGAARRRVRDQLTDVRRDVNARARTGALDVDDLADVADVAPTRPRSNALWCVGW